MKWAKKADKAQQAIRNALVKAGCSVHYLHTVGQGVPDLLVGYFGVTYLVEVKGDETAKESRRRTPLQVEWHAAWDGADVIIARNTEEALCSVSAIRCRWWKKSSSVIDFCGCGCGRQEEPSWITEARAAAVLERAAKKKAEGVELRRMRALDRQEKPL